MWRQRYLAIMALGVVWSFTAYSPRTQAQSEPNIVVHNDTTANGWQVRLSFKRAPGTFARAGHAWTLERAKEIAEKLRREHSGLDENLSVAEIRIEGQRGDGDIKKDKGPSPHLPDWPLVEHQFRVLNPTKSKELDKLLKELEKAWEEAAKATESALREGLEGTKIPEKRVQKLRELYGVYNHGAEQLEHKIFNGAAQPLPRLRMPNWNVVRDGVGDWGEAKRMQYRAEQMAEPIRKREAELHATREGILDEQKRIIFDDEAGRKTDTISQRQEELDSAIEQYGQELGSLSKKQQALAQIDKAAKQQIDALDDLLVDSNRVVPKADAFAAGPGGAAYESFPQLQVRKTDKDGAPLPDDEQPDGFPKPFAVGDLLKKGEGIFVDPNLRVELLDKKSDGVRAGVYARVRNIDPKAGKVTLQVGPAGTAIDLLGVQPEGIKTGQFISPTQRIGRLRPTRRNRKRRVIYIRARNRRKQLVNPGPVLRYGQTPPVAKGTLERNTPEVEPPELPVKKEAGKTDGKGDDRLVIDFDDSQKKRTKQKLGFLDAKELLAKKDLERAKAAEERAVDEAGLAAEKARQVERELEEAKDNLASISKSAQDVLKETESLQKRRKELQSRQEKLKADKRRLDTLARLVKSSRNNASIDAFNRMARDHNRREATFQRDVAKFRADERELRQRIASLIRERKKEEAKQLNLQMERDQRRLQADMAKRKLERYRSQAKAKEKTLNDIRQKRQKLQRELENTRPSDEDRRRQERSQPAGDGQSRAAPLPILRLGARKHDPV